ncbi:MAG TPA: pilus assembly PilX N-terminal domain-containing protein [Gaiellaceae bacterium]|nr:pilus assembly PilX N-terminal domain-containing protein [Gaiellaceae bacterium]
MSARAMRLFRFLRKEDGISLVMALGILGALSVTGSTLVYYSSANARSAEYSKDNTGSYVVAEAGINEMMSILAEPKNYALNKYLLGSNVDGTTTKTTHQYEDGTVTWWGTLDEAERRWTLTAVGTMKNPTGAASPVQRTLTAKVPVVPIHSRPLNSPAWNYIYSRATGNVCDTTIAQTVDVKSPFYAAGNVCMQNQAKISAGPLVVHGSVTMSQTANAIGSASTPIGEAHVKNGCKWTNNALHNPCVYGPGQGGKDNLWANTITNSPQPIPAPVPAWDDWYVKASPGPYYPCSLANSGPVPTFDNDQGSPQAPNPAMRNNSIPGIVHLTPNSSYTCQTAGGELSWNATTRVLTVKGTIYIDGSAKVENGQINTYNGHGSIYLSGTLLLKNSKLCAIVDGSNCTTTAWNPNEKMLVFVAEGAGGQVPIDTTVQLVSAHFQGALWATKAIDIGTTSLVDGPLDGSPVKLGQSSNSTFPGFTIVPVGMPGNDTVYAQPNPPELYGG